MVHACILGMIQGITEFLPVSSTAHLTIIPPLFGFEYQGRTVDVFLNLGTLLAVMVFFYKDVINLLIGAYDFLRMRGSREKDFFVTIVLASVPIVVIGAVAELVFNTAADSLLILSINLVLFGIVLFICDLNREQRKDVSRFHAVLIGCAQTLAIIPGVSRLGACLSMARFFKYEERSAFKFSMILSMPAAAGACALKLLKVFTGKIAVDDWNFVLIGAACAFVFGIITLRGMYAFLRKYNLKIFAMYRIFFGIAVLLSVFFTK